MADNQTISMALKTIKAAYPRFELQEDTVRVWASFLADIENELLLASVARFISSAPHAFPPSIPEIRKEAAELKREVIGIPTAFEAWEEVMRAPLPRPAGAPYRLFSGGQFVDEEEYSWPHEIVGLVARRLGWPTRFPSMDNEMADRAHFVKAFDQEVSKLMRLETQVPMVSDYIERERGLLLDDRLDDRRAALDTGERRDVARQMQRLTMGMEQ